MHLKNRAARLVAVLAATAAIGLTMGVNTAGAAVAAPHSTTAHATAATKPKPKPNAQQIPAAPSGCNNGNLCEYNSGNGGSLCFQWAKNGDWPGACEHRNEGEYNRNHNAVYLQGNPSSHYCTYLLYSGNYLLYNAKDHFESSGCTGYTLEHHLYANSFV